MFGFIKKCFFATMTFFSCNALKSVSMNNKESKVGPAVILMIHMRNYAFLILLKI